MFRLALDLLRSTVRRLFAPRRPGPGPVPRRLRVELLECRLTPADIQITAVPTYAGGPNGMLRGVVTGVDPNSYRVAPYILTEGMGWYTKPTEAGRTVPINSDGTFVANVGTGDQDDLATIFAAALVPAGVTPPLANGAGRIPATLAAVDIAYAERYGRTIQFAGRTWGVKESRIPVGPAGVGPPNRFSIQPDDVFVDANGHLNLGVTFRDGQWWSTEVVLLDRLGYGTYSFQTTSDLRNLDPNLLFSGFLWDNYGDGAGNNPHREIDFEDARLGNAGNATNAQMVVQPHTTAGNVRRYTIPNLGADPSLTRMFRWQPGQIQFVAARGLRTPEDVPAAGVIDQLAYTQNAAANRFVPTPGRESFRFNAWVYAGGAPANGANVRIVVKDFAFTPLTAPVVSGPARVTVPPGGQFEFLNGFAFAVTDADAGVSDETVSVSATAGTVTVNTAGVTVVGGGSGTAAVSFRGSLANVKAALATLRYTAPASGSAATLTVSANDGTFGSNNFQTVVNIQGGAAPAAVLYAGFPDHGPYAWTAANSFLHLHTVPAEELAVGSDGFAYLDFGGFGLYRWSAPTGFQLLNGTNPEDLATGPDGYLYVDFGPAHGLYRWSAGTGFLRLNTVSPEEIAVGSDAVLYADFGPAYGLYRWTAAGGYQRLNTVSPEGIVGGLDGFLYADFGPAYGFYRWSAATGFQLLNTVSPNTFAAGPGGVLYVSFEGYGLYRWTAAAGYQFIHSVAAEELAVGTDGTLLADYGGFGLYAWSPATGFILMTPIDPRGLAARKYY